MNIKELQFKLFGYTVEITVHKNKYSRKFAKELLQKSYYQECYGRVPKIALIKALRDIHPNPNLQLKEAKEMVEDMFEFDSPAGLPRLK